jgi:hypothetical protein
MKSLRSALLFAASLAFHCATASGGRQQSGPMISQQARARVATDTTLHAKE